MKESWAEQRVTFMYSYCDCTLNISEVGYSAPQFLVNVCCILLYAVAVILATMNVFVVEIIKCVSYVVCSLISQISCILKSMVVPKLFTI